jgi:hypothetical protein
VSQADAARAKAQGWLGDFWTWAARKRQAAATAQSVKLTAAEAERAKAAGVSLAQAQEAKALGQFDAALEWATSERAKRQNAGAGQ